MSRYGPDASQVPLTMAPRMADEPPVSLVTLPASVSDIRKPAELTAE